MADFHVATGTTILFGTSGFQANVNVESLRFGGVTRPAIQTTKLNETQPTTNQFGGHKFTPGLLADPGEVGMEIQFDPELGKRPPIWAAAETITITYPDASTIGGSGFITSMGPITAGIDALLKCDITIKCSGLWT